MFRPEGAGHLIRWIQSFSTFSLYFKAASLILGREMKARTLIIRSGMPLWLSAEKCVPTASLSSCLKRMGSSIRRFRYAVIFPQWPWNRSKIVLLVWPTYCLSQVLHVMQYTRFELLHVMFFLVQNFLPVTWQVIVPLQFSSGQYWHAFLARHLFFSRFGLATEVRDLLLVGAIMVLSTKSPAEVLDVSVVP